jgi:capsular polysaccharide biosynthesis protein
MIAEETIKALGVDMAPEVLIKNLRVSPRGDTQILEISVQDTNQKRVIQTANTFSKVFVEKVREMMSTDDLTIVDEARPPARLVMPDMLMNMVIGALAGLILSFVIAFLAERADTTLKSVEEVEKKIGIQVLESIPYMNNF